MVRRILVMSIPMVRSVSEWENLSVAHRNTRLVLPTLLYPRRSNLI